ncbi:MarR family winged helix-turn-helix transcriptional regulator [Nocardioides sp.]|uniref:MarR family winged helix-turn-helix transcriptional regulator n=1 Tax=Nocardioides sp. TaxID=35761 RepID=UPI002732444C|nr:MarR family transcriptional regulator [Nocardioides sp.]MDP3892106.1 MarR family transcriptional regulator [Nocardioides sp.]
MVPTVEKLTRTDAGLASQLRVSVARLSRRLRNERDPDSTISVSGLSVLGVLFREGESTVGRLAEHERVRPPSMTRTVSCLVEDGYVVRRPHDTDGRQTVLTLSEKGEETVRVERRRRDAWLAVRLRELSPEERDVLRRAAPILEALSQKG